MIDLVDLIYCRYNLTNDRQGAVPLVVLHYQSDILWGMARGFPQLCVSC